MYALYTTKTAFYFSLVFLRKDLCEAKHETSSVFKFGRSNSPGSGIWWPRVELTLRQIRWQIHPPVLASGGQELNKQADQVADLTPVVPSSGQEWQYDISSVRAHIGRSTGRSTPRYSYLVVKNGDMTFLLLELILADQLADLPPTNQS